MHWRDTFETVQSSKPSSSYGTCWVRVSAVQHSAQTKLFPVVFWVKKGIISYDDTVDSKSSRPSIDRYFMIKLFSFLDSILVWKFSFTGFIDRNTSLFCIIFPALLKFGPISIIQIIFSLSIHWYILFGYWKSFFE